MPSRVEPSVLASLDPYWVVDRTDGYLAATVPERDELRGIWDLSTGELVVPAVAACWIPGQDEILVVTDEYSGELERRTWPENERVAATEVQHSEGWVDHVAAAPTGALAAVRWIDQTEAGFELFALADGSVEQLAGSGYRTGESNLLQGPVFDPAGRRAAVTEGRFAWWTGEGEEGPSPGGTFTAGRLTVVDVDSGEARHEPVEVEVPGGWEPADDAAREGLLGPPRFVDGNTVVLELPTGEERRIDLT